MVGIGWSERAYLAIAPQAVLIPLLIAAAVVAIVGLVYLFQKIENDRRDRWFRAASAKGWTYQAGKDRDVADYFEFLNELGDGRDRYAEDVVRGEEYGRPFFAFSYHYETTTGSGEDRRTVDHWMSVVAVQLERPFPELLIAPEHFGKRLLHKVFGGDIDFESHEFSKQFEVRSRDRKFAYDFCNTAMMEYLLDHPGTNIEVEGHWMATVGDDKLSFDQIQPGINHLTNIRTRMPRFLFT